MAKTELVRMFEEIRDKIGKDYRKIRKVRLVHSVEEDRLHQISPRHFATMVVGPKERTIYYAKALEKQPEWRMRGVLWHEFGHLLDELYGIRVPEDPTVWEETMKVAEVHGGDMKAEVRANTIVKALYGVRIRYDEEGVQYVGTRKCNTGALAEVPYFYDGVLSNPGTGIGVIKGWSSYMLNLKKIIALASREIMKKSSAPMAAPMGITISPPDPMASTRAYDLLEGYRPTLSLPLVMRHSMEEAMENGDLRKAKEIKEELERVLANMGELFDLLFSVIGYTISLKRAPNDEDVEWWIQYGGPEEKKEVRRSPGKRPGKRTGKKWVPLLLKGEDKVVIWNFLKGGGLGVLFGPPNYEPADLETLINWFSDPQFPKKMAEGLVNYLPGYIQSLDWAKEEEVLRYCRSPALTMVVEYKKGGKKKSIAPTTAPGGTPEPEPEPEPEPVVGVEEFDEPFTLVDIEFPPDLTSDEVVIRTTSGSTILKRISHKLDGDVNYYLGKIRNAYYGLREVFKFPSELVSELVMTAWLIEDGSLVLKGVPGTGKTTLVTLMAHLFLNDLKLTDEINSSDVENYLTQHHLFGVAKHNKDKEPIDVYYRTGITTVEAKPNISSMRKNPPEWLIKKYQEFLEKGGKGQVSVEKISTFFFTPEPRPVVQSVVKLHNEANRQNPNVADTTLGLLAEKEIEYLGEPIATPKWGKKYGCLNFFDYNPHLEMMDPRMELDRALLDRIDLGLYMTSPPLSEKVKVLMSKYGLLKGRRLADQLLDRMRSGEIPQFGYPELLRIWSYVDQVRLTTRQFYLVACAVGYFSTIYMVYDESRYLDDVPQTSFDYPEEFLDYIRERLKQYRFDFEAPGFERRTINPETIVFPDGISKGARKISEGSTDILDRMTAMNSIVRHYGMRPMESMVKALKAYAFLKAALSGVKVEKIGDIKIKDEWILDLLPHVLEHRINLGAGDFIKSQFLNFGDFIRAWLIPQVFIADGLWYKWNKYIDALILFKNEEEDREKKFLRYVAEHVETYDSEEDVLKDMAEEPTLYMLYTALKD